MSEANKLPSGWIIDSLGNIFYTTSGGTPSRKRSEYYNGNIPWVKSGELDKGLILDTEEKISELAIKDSSAKIFPKGTLLIALYGATIGKLGFLGIDAATNQAVCGIFSNEIVDLKFLSHYLFSKRQQLIDQGIGGAQPNISQTILKSLSLPLPPLPEQHQIVAKIEELFSDLDNGIGSLKTAQQQLKVYRQAVLKAAFEGKLTGKRQNCDLCDGDERHDGKQGERPFLQNHGHHNNHKNHSSDNDGLPEGDALSLPKGWKWVKVSDTGKVQLGRQRSPKNISKNYPTKYIRAANITVNGFELTDILEMEFTPKELQQYQLRKGDILLSEASGSASHVGKPAIWKDEIQNCCFQNTVIRLRSNGLCSNEYLLWLFKSFYSSGKFAKIAGGVGINHLSANKFSNIDVPLPPTLEEQSAIVAEIESRLSVCDKIEESIEYSLNQAEALRQSILKKAFEGKLIPQDASDEPASVLLERIRAEKAQVNTEKPIEKKPAAGKKTAAAVKQGRKLKK